MGIELDESERRFYNARCDRCNRFVYLRTRSVASAGALLRKLGWRRFGYRQILHHFLWMCPSHDA